MGMRWTNSVEELPKENGYYLVYVPQGKGYFDTIMFMCFWSQDSENWHLPYDGLTVDWWMDIPIPPENNSK